MLTDFAVAVAVAVAVVVVVAVVDVVVVVATVNWSNYSFRQSIFIPTHCSVFS